jgi:hypothetical protein
MLDSSADRMLDPSVLAEPLERVMHKRDVQLTPGSLQFFDGAIEGTAADPELVVIVVALAEQGGVHEQEPQAPAVHFNPFHGTS